MSGAVNRRRFLRDGLLGATGVVGGFVAGRSTNSTPAGAAATVEPDNPTEVDIGFCTDMSAHHVQALAICQRVLGRDTGDEVQAAASEVLQNQAIELGQMRAWLVDWGESTAEPATVMGWMLGYEDEVGDELSQPVICNVAFSEMIGVASDEDLRALSEARGREQGRRWLTLMRAHHEGGVAMATAAARLASADKVVRLASWQAQVQAFEISQYDQLLATTYA